MYQNFYRSAKKKREIEGESLIIEQDATVGQSVSLDNVHNRKKPKKQRTREDS